MANSKVIGGIIIAIVIIIAVAAFAMSGSETVTSDVEDTTNDLATTISDSAIISKNIVEDENNPDYYVDEEGVKRYIISAIDIPTLGD